MLHPVKLFLAASGVALLTAQSPFAQDEPNPSQVVATVNGTEITLGHVIALRAELPPQYNQFPAELLLQGIVDQLVQHTLLMQSIENEDPSFRSKIAIENETRAILAGQVMSRIRGNEPSEDEIETLYNELYPEDANEAEYRAAHILVETEEEAKSLITELEDGADFARLAREHSTGPSGAAGGDLGWFGDGDMVADFFDAVVKLEVGGVSPPVKTTFGWHIIQLNETRDKARPEIETVRAELVEQARQTALDAFVQKLEAEGKVTQNDLSEIDPEVITNFELLGN